ncbi:expansin (peptidoglycan-binding protein) [Streptomyces achromogenes]|uniref:Expansin (Peptidoglycan-binding protein) n=1 Tax=Streptomyces achromogenes TaxID=67255 RepID=A0ABU0Q1G8_STRAH|nr:expansin EXLX1 family cellulose-binding protein [Streptomyces achromogenes]MDQ0684487.1 expansin (peptidoglycan-binding protein) [Streptomyces achromogenes]MDQ0831656.1 expansin (peptidoglycan-binding protein) [Streptomyces achromogenes]
MAASSHRRSRRPGRGPVRVPVVTVVAVAAVALVVSLVVAFRPGGGSDDVREAGAPAAGARVSGSATPTTAETSASPKPSTSTSPSPSPSPTAGGTKTPPATRSARPSAEAAAPAARSASGAGPLAGRIRPGASYDGVATSYDAGDGSGACSYGPTSDVMTAAMNTADYETSKACGAYVAVRVAGGASITVRITNECPAPCAPGQLDLSHQAFAKLAPLSTGRIPITWSLLSPATSDTIAIRYKTGSSQYWCGIQAVGHRNPVARLEVRSGGSWIRLARTDYNYFLSENGTGCGGAIRLTDIYGERLTVEGIAVRPEAVQPTRVQFARH